MWYLAKGNGQYVVFNSSSHQVGTVQKVGQRWIAFTPAMKKLGSFANMSLAGEKLAREDEKNEVPEI